MYVRVVLQYAPSRTPEPAHSIPVVVIPPVVSLSSSIATTADVSAGSFAGVSDADQIAAIRRLYTVINPDKMHQVWFFERQQFIAFIAFIACDNVGTSTSFNNNTCTPLSLVTGGRGVAEVRSWYLGSTG